MRDLLDETSKTVYQSNAEYKAADQRVAAPSTCDRPSRGRAPWASGPVGDFHHDAAPNIESQFAETGPAALTRPRTRPGGGCRCATGRTGTRTSARPRPARRPTPSRSPGGTPSGGGCSAAARCWWRRCSGRCSRAGPGSRWGQPRRRVFTQHSPGSGVSLASAPSQPRPSATPWTTPGSTGKPGRCARGPVRRTDSSRQNLVGLHAGS